MENQLVTILRITSPQLGNYVKNKLEEHGIEVFFTDEGRALGSNYNPDEVVLKVKSNNTEEAVKILLRVHKDYDLDEITKNHRFKDLKKILFPVLLTPQCIDYCTYVLQLAKDINAEVKILYVYEDPMIDESVRHTVSWEKHVKLQLQECNRNAQMKLFEFSLELKKNVPKELLEAVKVHFRMLKGTRENVITESAERYKPDLLLMPTPGKLNQGEFFSKDTLKVIERTQFPVLAFPKKSQFKRNNKLSVMYATNFYDSDNTALRKLLKVLEPFDKEIHCVHIERKNDPKLQEKVCELNDMLAKEFSEHSILFELVEHDNLEKGFVKFIDDNKIDIISLSKIKRSAFYRIFHPSLLERLVSFNKVPVLIFPV